MNSGVGKMRSVNVGLVGFGFSGATFHAPIVNAVQGLNLRKVVSSNAEKVRSSLSDVSVVESFDLLIEDDEIELVIITTPNEHHFPMAKQALESGKHVVIEKPFAVSVDECERLIDVAQTNGKLLSVYHNRRFDSDFLTIQKLLKEDHLGEVMTFEAHYDRYRAEVRDRWREQDRKGSGILFDLGSHLIDQALTLFGIPDAISADVMAQREDGKTDDYFHLILHYGRKRIILHGGSLVMQHGPRYQIHGMKGSFVKSGIDPQEEALKQGRSPGDSGWGEESSQYYGVLTQNENESVVKSVPGSYQTYYEDMYRAICENEPLPVMAKEALNVIKVIELAVKSSEEKRMIEWT